VLNTQYMYFNSVDSQESEILSIGLLCHCVAKETICSNTDELRDKPMGD